MISDVNDSVLTVRQVAERLKVGRSTVRAYINRGRLKACRLDGSYRVFLTDLEEFLQSRMHMQRKKKEVNEE